jgi:hypothetical protein
MGAKKTSLPKILGWNSNAFVDARASVEQPIGPDCSTCKAFHSTARPHHFMFE